MPHRGQRRALISLPKNELQCGHLQLSSVNTTALKRKKSRMIVNTASSIKLRFWNCDKTKYSRMIRTHVTAMINCFFLRFWYSPFTDKDMHFPSYDARILAQPIARGMNALASKVRNHYWRSSAPQKLPSSHELNQYYHFKSSPVSWRYKRIEICYKWSPSRTAYAIVGSTDIVTAQAQTKHSKVDIYAKKAR